MKRFFTRSLLPALVLCLLCFPASTPAGAETLMGAGATFPYPLYSQWFDSYKAARISYQAIGNHAGRLQLQRGAVDFCASDMPLADAEQKTMPQPIAHIPTVGRSVAIAYNLPELRRQRKQLRLNGRVLAGIYAGLITRWNDERLVQLNPGVQLSNRPITTTRTYFRSASRLFANYLSAASPMWRRSIGPAEPDDGPRSGGGRSGEGIAALVRSTPGSITYVEFAYATNNGLTYAAIQNRDGQFVSPSVNSVIAAITNSAPQLRRDVRSPIVNAPGAGSYPISGLTYILLPQKGNDKAKRTALLRFLNWATTDGQRFARPLLYAPLPRSLVQKNQATLRSLR